MGLPGSKSTLYPGPSLPLNETSLEIGNQCNQENQAFTGGEEIVYKIYYNWNFVWMAAGELTLRVQDAGEQWHISAHGSTYKSYDTFFRVRDKYDTYVDKETLLPTVSIRDVQEGNYTLYDKILFDQRKGTATSTRGKTKDSAETEVYPIEQCMHDLVSILYFSRNLDFESMADGEIFPVKIFMDEKTWPLKVRYYGAEGKKKVRGSGKYDTLVFGPEVISGYVFDEDSKMKAWVSNDQNRIPLLIESPLSVGSVKVMLKSAKGLRHEMTAKR